MQVFTNFDGIRQCTICEAPARYIYFGALACPSCKMFFKRNAENKQRKMICRYNSRCKIDIWTRQACPSCRLAKCFRSGMRIEMLRASVQTTIRPKQHPQRDTSHSNTQIATLNLLRSDQSQLSSDQWTLLTNLIHGYDESKILIYAQRLKNIYNLSSEVQSSYQKLTQDFMSCLYEASGNCILANIDFRQLPSHDRSVVLTNAANDISCLSATYILQRTSLLENQLFSQFSDLNYGQMTANHHRRIMRFLNIDDALVKMILSLIIFSMNGRVFNRNVEIDLINTLNILHIQNRYVETTWKYLVYKYGFYRAVNEFMKMVQCLLAASEFLIHAQHTVLHQHDIDSLVEKTEINLILDDIPM